MELNVLLIPECLLSSKEFTMMEKAVWSFLALRAVDNSGFPSNNEIALALGTPRRTITNALRSLNNKKIIHTIPPSDKQKAAHKNSKYRFFAHPVFNQYTRTNAAYMATPTIKNIINFDGQKLPIAEVQKLPIDRRVKITHPIIEKRLKDFKPLKTKAKSKTKKKDVKKEFNPTESLALFTPLYQNHDEFKSTWFELCEHRQLIKVPFTNLAAKKIANKLMKYPIEESIEMMNATIATGKWTDVYPIKQSQNNQRNKHQQKPLAEGRRTFEEIESTYIGPCNPNYEEYKRKLKGLNS